MRHVDPLLTPWALCSLPSLLCLRALAAYLLGAVLAAGAIETVAVLCKVDEELDPRDTFGAISLTKVGIARLTVAIGRAIPRRGQNVKV
jgi:hypothetical protein